MREKFDKIVNSRFGRRVDKIINTPWYSAVIAAVCILCHTLEIPVVGAFLLTVLLVLSLLFCRNSFVLVPFLFMCSFVVSEDTSPQSGYFNSAAKLVPLCLMLVFIAVAFIFNIVYYGKWKKIFKRAYLTVSLALVSGLLIVGGLFSPSYSFASVGIAASIGVVMFLPYSFLVNCGEYEGKKTVEYLAYAALAVSAIIFVAVLKQLIIHGFSFAGAKSYMRFGFAGPNTSAAFVLICIPFTFYLVYKYKRGFLLLPIVAVQLFCIIATASRASLVVAIPGVVIVSIAMCFKKKSGRLGYLIMFGIAVAAAVAITVLFRNYIFGKILNVFDGKMHDSGRFKLWRWGAEEWADNPMFGFGFTYIEKFGGYKPAYNHSFHCTPITYLFSAGIFGLCAYIYHRYKTVRLMFSAKLTSERVFVALCVLAMLCNALLDVGMNTQQHLLFYSILLAVLEQDVRFLKNR